MYPIVNGRSLNSPCTKTSFIQYRYDVIARTLLGHRVADDTNDGSGIGVIDVGDGKRIERLERKLGRLEDGLWFMNDLLWCHVDSLI